ncbi:MAG TPA: cupin domain-containing protein [Opitutaceae bacterium]|nr:cupin domain-containing protein [Opitutaceae bacterium]
MRLTPENALRSLSEHHGRKFIELFKHGSLVLEVYKPDKVDLQTPHSRDEVYVIISGHGHFVKGGVRQPFQAGEFLFAPAGVDHRFEDFSDDFATWVIFYGPQGGEAAKT